jgi:hypothetical protein
MDFRGRREADGATLERPEFPPVSVLPEWARATCGDASADELNYDPEESQALRPAPLQKNFTAGVWFWESQGHFEYF